MKYSGKGGNQTKEKADRKDIYNPIGGHIEQGENVIQNAIKEAKEEAGITLLQPKIKGVISISGFAGKNMVNFIIVGTTKDEALKSTLEGELHWVELGDIESLNTFADIKPILDKILTVKPSKMFVGTASFVGFKLVDIQLSVI